MCNSFAEFQLLAFIAFKVHLELSYNHFCFTDIGIVHMLAFFSENMRHEFETSNDNDFE